MPAVHFIRAGRVTLSAIAASWAATVLAQDPAPIKSSYTVFLRSVPIGSEQVTTERTDNGWTITSSGRLGAPLDLTTRLMEVKYTADWKPVELSFDATSQGQPLLVHTQIANNSASSDITQAAATAHRTDAISGDAVLLQNGVWGPFEALSQRLRGASAGSSIPIYLTPVATTVAVADSATETFQTPDRLIRARRTTVKMPAGGAMIDVDVWGDEEGHLLRLSIPAQNLDVVREDLAPVATRRVNVSRAGDEQVRIPSNGFTFAATISKPTANPGNRPLPAVVLVGGSGPADRDETVFGIPIFGQLANALADAGFLVLRYDKRGVGQSGGRPEAATLDDYRDDLRDVLKFVGDRKDVDRKRIAVLGHSECGMVAMLDAAKDNRIAALVLAATPGVRGADLNLYQVEHQLDTAHVVDPQRQTSIDLQKRIQTAALTGTGWENIPDRYRAQAQIPWFQSFLAFDPAKVMSDVDQPILIVQGLLDTQVPPSNADRLETLAKARKKAGASEVVRLPGVNHLLASATTGEVDEYSRLPDKRVNPSVSEAIIAWLKKTL